MTPTQVPSVVARSAGDPKVRYVGFRLQADTPVSRKAFIDALRRAGDRFPADQVAAAEPWLTRYDGTRGIVRCTHTHAALVRRLLDHMDTARTDGETVAVHVTPVGTAGTIRALVEKHLSDLEDLGQRK